eukprot:UN20410
MCALKQICLNRFLIARPSWECNHMHQIISESDWQQLMSRLGKMFAVVVACLVVTGMRACARILPSEPLSPTARRLWASRIVKIKHSASRVMSGASMASQDRRKAWMHTTARQPRNNLRLMMSSQPRVCWIWAMFAMSLGEKHD